MILTPHEEDSASNSHPGNDQTGLHATPSVQFEHPEEEINPSTSKEVIEPDSDSDLSTDIIGIDTYEAELPRKKDFLPWHRPRKQFVRHKQWLEQINRMLEGMIPENNVLKYLGLPGEDLLDLRYFHHKVCVPKNLALKYLGFNHGAKSTSQSAELNISIDEISKLSLIDPSSIILGDDFSQLAKINSIAWDRSTKMGPFDIINIDLCDGFAKEPTNPFKKTHYDTVVQLMTLQARRTNPWLLFLTTRTGKDHIDGGIFEQLKKLYGDNLINCPPFEQHSKTVFSISNSVNLDEAIKIDKGLSNVFLTSLCKWIASIALGQRPPAKVEVRSVLGYKVAKSVDHLDLVSLAIMIEPTLIPAPDKLGLSTAKDTPNNECSVAVQAVKRVSGMLDIDQLLDENPGIMEEMISMSSSLLEEARYDIASYQAWLTAN